MNGHTAFSPRSVETLPLTTIVSVRRHGKVVMGGDGQVSLGNTVMKGNAKKFVACTTARSLPVLPAPPLTPLPSSNVSKANLKSIRVTWYAPLSSSQRNGVPIAP